MFPALLQIIHSWALFCLASLASVLISHRGYWAHLGSANTLIATEIETPLLEGTSQGKVCLWVLAVWGESSCPGRVVWAAAVQGINHCSKLLHWIKSQFRAPLRASLAPWAQKQMLLFFSVIWSTPQWICPSAHKSRSCSATGISQVRMY